jgi:hypothetical protein
MASHNLENNLAGGVLVIVVGRFYRAFGLSAVLTFRRWLRLEKSLVRAVFATRASRRRRIRSAPARTRPWVAIAATRLVASAVPIAAVPRQFPHGLDGLDAA